MSTYKEYVYHFTFQLALLPYFPYHFSIQPTFLPHFPYLLTIQLTFLFFSIANVLICFKVDENFPLPTEES
jgi:hypothetical protein